MSKPLRLFIKPPYNGWTLIHGYGTDAADPSVMHPHLLLEKTGTAQVLAATTGKLSIREPSAGNLEANEEFVLPAQNEPLPQTVTIYLHTWPTTLAINSVFRARAQEINSINGFAYINVATSSLEAALADVLDSATIPRGTLTHAQIVDRFVRGELSLFVSAGHVIGEASAEGAPSGSVRLGFTALTNCGPLDPAYVYDWMRDFVEDGQPDLDAFLVLAPKKWPVVDPTLTADAVVTLTESTLYPWHVLHSLKTSRNLDTQWRDEGGTNKSLWRLVGNNQKVLWRERLLMRTGHPAAGSTAPPFEFDDLDWQNLFQLEAVVEFYANFDDPWRAGATPPNPGTAGYTTVDFLNLSGAAATVSGKVVTLDGNPDLSRVRKYRNRTKVKNEFRDTLFLESDTARASKLYTITAVDDAANTVTLDQPPALPGGTSAWEIRLRTVAVIIDSFGRRPELSGSAATAAGTVLTLDGTPNIRKVNTNFDTIYLPSDTARASRTYRITEVNDDADTVTVDAAPALDNGSSRWHIPSGISGELPILDYTLGPGGALGYDHYDGVLFVMQDEEIHQKIRYGSFSSRTQTGQGLSSIRGNRAYDFISFRSSKSDIRNYCFRVTDHGSLYDGVREARFYFSTPVTDDNAPMGQDPINDGPGKTVIRIHYGNYNGSGSGSAGCLVSFSFQDVRDAIIERYQDEYVALNGSPQDGEVQKAHGRNLKQSKDLWANKGQSGLTEENWNDKIMGTFWVIHPDERPS